MGPYDQVRYLVSTRGGRLAFGLHRLLLHASGGWLLPTSGRMPVLLLTTIGRKSWQPRTQPLAYLADGDRLVLTASNSGSEHPPAWYLNLLANPRVEVRIGRQVRAMRATVASVEEKRRLWPELVRRDPLYAAYQRRTTRDIPVVLLLCDG